MASMEERSKTLVLEAFNTLFNKRDYAYRNRLVRAAPDGYTLLMAGRTSNRRD
jgi:hypothetical protein